MAHLYFVTTIVQTEYIDNELNPIWLPWTERAFSFDITHPLSPLFVSVFDYDFGVDHDGIGRIAIDLNQFEVNMVYTLQYNLYPASNISEREVGFCTCNIF